MAETVAAWVSSHVGHLRRVNQDRCCTPSWRSTGRNESWSGALKREGGWLVIADGMGGHRAGEIASEIALEALGRQLPRIVTEDDILAAIDAANDSVHDAMSTTGGMPGMGTTIVGALFKGGAVTFFNVGDSRAYVLRGRRLEMHSVDHTPGGGSGGMRRSHALTQSLGGTLTRRRLKPEVSKVSLRAGDIIVLCSDGLTDLVSEEGIVSCLHDGRLQPADELVAAALGAGGRDNVTVAVAEI